MPYTLKTNQISVKDPETGEYSGVDILAEQTEQGLIAELQAEGTAQVNRINQAAVDVQSAVDKAETDAAKIISDTQTSVNTLEAQKNTIAQTVASMAELGTDTTLSTPGMAADAGAVGDLSRQLSDTNSNIVYLQETYGKNYVNLVETDVKFGYALSEANQESQNQNFKIVGPIEVPSSRWMTVSVENNSYKNYIRVLAYDSNGDFIGQLVTFEAELKEYRFQTQSNCKYLKISLRRELKQIQVELGNSATDFQCGFTAKDDYARGLINEIDIKHTNAEEAIQSEIEAEFDIVTDKIANTVETYGKNEFNAISVDATYDKSLAPDGNEIDNTNYVIYGYIPVVPTSQLVLSFEQNTLGNTVRVHGYGQDKSWIKELRNFTVSQRYSAFYVDNNIYFLRISIPKSIDVFSIQLEHGYTPTNYVQGYTSVDNKARDMLNIINDNAIYGIDTYLNTGKMQYVAHRGARLDAPENSIPAFEKAGQQGFDWLNLAQLRQSLDGTWYVLHDATLASTTDVETVFPDAASYNISSFTDVQIAQIHINTGAHVDDFTPSELVVPTLETAIQIARKYGMKLYFRIGAIPASWDSFNEIIRKYRCKGMLFGANALSEVLPMAQEGYCVNYDVYSVADAEAQIAGYVANGIKNATLFVQMDLLTNELVKSARDNGYKVMVFDPNVSGANITKAIAQQLSDMGVDLVSSAKNFDLAQSS